MRRALFIAAFISALWLAPGALASGWCGGATDESAADRPDLITGAQVHAIVVTPSDSPDQFAAVANRLADDVTAMSAWWTAQDTTRVPRYDQAMFSGVPCLDISFVHLNQPASSFQGNTAFRALQAALGTSGFGSLFKDYVVYYDGPSVEPDICGTGAGSFDAGDGLAVVWLNGCPDVPSVEIETHELLHAFGALPAGAPNACTPATDPAGIADFGHPCDSQSDVLFPYADGRPLDQLVLDFNHDDYYAHGGTQNDIQDAIFLRHLDTPEETLGLTISGKGGVTSDLPGVDCQASCTTQWDQGTALTLTPDPAEGSRFVHWSGNCIGRADCVLDLSKATAVDAVFGPATIPVKLSTNGQGRVACSPACSKRFSAGTRLTLHALPAKGWKFKSWGGACTGSRLTCTPKTDAAVSVRANFKKKR